MIAVCPRCDIPLAVLSWDGLDVDTCPACRGLWLDHGEIEELLRAAGGRPDDALLGFMQGQGRASASSRRHLCPRCDARLVEVEPPPEACRSRPFQIDKCPRGHGLWFDPGELTSLLESFPPETGAGGAVTALGNLLGMDVKKQPEEC